MLQKLVKWCMVPQHHDQISPHQEDPGLSFPNCADCSHLSLPAWFLVDVSGTSIWPALRARQAGSWALTNKAAHFSWDPPVANRCRQRARSPVFSSTFWRAGHTRVWSTPFTQEAFSARSPLPPKQSQDQRGEPALPREPTPHRAERKPPCSKATMDANSRPSLCLVANYSPTAGVVWACLLRRDFSLSFPVSCQMKACSFLKDSSSHSSSRLPTI